MHLQNSKITKEICTQRLLVTFPEFSGLLKEWRTAWKGSDFFYMELSLFADYMTKMNQEEVSKAFALIEELIKMGDAYVSTAICTGLLESIANLLDDTKLDFMTVSRFIGPESKKYLKAWDEFCGIKTKWS